MVDGYESQLKEIQEAIDAAEEALGSLQKAKKYLDSASGWGIFDIMGGGFLATAIKRDKMSQARLEMDRAQRALEDFNRELRDVVDAGQFDLNMDSFMTVADYMFDNPLIDFMVQGKIRDAQKTVEDAICEVQRIEDQLVDQQEMIVSDMDQ